MRKLIVSLLVALLVCLAHYPVTAGDLEFDSFEAAEKASQKRAQEYQKKMDDHMQNIQNEWEQQQKDLGSDASNPDITKITSSSDGQRSSDTEAADGMKNAVDSSVNNLKNTMINTAGPNSTGFAGGGAGYQWKVKYVGGKYVLSDSYNEADFNTGKKKDTPAASKPATPPKEADASNSKTTVANKTSEKPETAGTQPATTPSEPATSEIAKAPTSPTSGAKPGASSPSSSSSSPSAPSTPDKGGSSGAAAPDKNGSSTSESTSPGVDPAPATLPPPKVRLVIQHPTDFSEEVFASNTDNKSAVAYGLEKFRIPEDTRVKIAVELSEDIDPEDVTLVMVDEEGERTPVKASRMGNYRHLFRVPSEGAYSANIYVTDKENPGNHQKKLMEVKIPVTKVDFDSRTIENQSGSKTGDGSSSSEMSSTSSSGSVGGYSHSSSGQSQQVDLSDFYSNPGSANSQPDSGGEASGGEASGDGASGGATSGEISSDTSGGAGSSGSDSSSNYAGNEGSGYSGSNQYSSQRGSSGQGYSSGGATDGTSNSDQSGVTGQNTDGSNNNTGNAGSSAGTSGTADGSDSGSSYGNTSDDEESGSEGSYNSGAAGGSEHSTKGASGNSSSDGSSSINTSENSGYYSDSADSDACNEKEGNASSANGQYYGNYASAQGNSPSGSKKQDASKSAATAATANGEEKDEPVEEDNFIMAVALRSEAHKIYQSFDFAEESTQTSTTLPANSEIIFNIVLGKQVDFESVGINMADGGEEFGGNLRTMGEAFGYSFKNESPNSYINITGRSGKQPFSYLLKLPVVKK